MSTPDRLVRAPARAPVRPAGRRRRLAVWLRYCAVSAVSTGTSLATLGVLVGGAAVNATVANVIATAIGTIPSFELNRRWVWAHHGRRSVVHQVVPFVALSLAGLVLSTLAVHVAAGRTVDWSRGWHTVAVEAANVAAYGGLWILQFFVLDRVLFARPGFAARSQLGRSRFAGQWPRVRPWQRPWPHQLPSTSGRTGTGRRRRPAQRRPARRHPEVTAGDKLGGSCPPSSPYWRPPRSPTSGT